jgi:hypothetical protein
LYSTLRYAKHAATLTGTLGLFDGTGWLAAVPVDDVIR